MRVSLSLPLLRNIAELRTTLSKRGVRTNLLVRIPLIGGKKK